MNETHFSDFELHPRLMQAVDDLGFIEPTPVQAKAIPPALAGRDLIGLAQTGTGKSAAFILPILQRLLDGKPGRVRALVIAPTRELTEQLGGDFGDLARHTRLRAATVTGGVRYKPQIDRLRKGVEIVVATPGRLIDLMGRGDADLRDLEVLVLDEADRMLDMGFLPDIRRILRKLPGGRQTMMFSATMPYDIRRLAEEILVDPVHVELGVRVPLETISHALYAVAPPHKTEMLLAILRLTGTGSVLVFTRTRHAARHTGASLKKAGISASIIEGDMPQPKRKQALDGFRAGKFRVLVATDIAARGLDISNVTHVINYDMPSTVDDYTHRIGRTGRAERSGQAFTLVTHEDLEMVAGIERVLDIELPYRRLEGFPHPPPPWDPTGRERPQKTPRRPRRPVRRPLGRR